MPESVINWALKLVSGIRTFFGDARIRNINVDDFLFGLVPRAAKHAGKVRALTQVHLVQFPRLAAGLNRDVRVLGV